ncbi:hypothetical protein [Methanospirillum lacunae]|uniref:Uncharacterized protein n=1 Tax=Methanospirillum lacunae TaxID=668570 RepID=A0A2V2N6Y0_9EURY|nr:hypothetical protein [Methanospirillum lacunae]PWR71987.1 hypothetical protein DK846_08305 [Methanospirillum lacunae]
MIPGEAKHGCEQAYIQAADAASSGGKINCHSEIFTLILNPNAMINYLDSVGGIAADPGIRYR